jgi:hypothetical protein
MRARETLRVAAVAAFAAPCFATEPCLLPLPAWMQHCSPWCLSTGVLGSVVVPSSLVLWFLVREGVYDHQQQGSIAIYISIDELSIQTSDQTVKAGKRLETGHLTISNCGYEVNLVVYMTEGLPECVLLGDQQL